MMTVIVKCDNEVCDFNLDNLCVSEEIDINIVRGEGRCICVTEKINDQVLD